MLQVQKDIDQQASSTHKLHFARKLIDAFYSESTNGTKSQRDQPFTLERISTSKSRNDVSLHLQHDIIQDRLWRHTIHIHLRSNVHRQVSEGVTLHLKEEIVKQIHPDYHSLKKCEL